MTQRNYLSENIEISVNDYSLLFSPFNIWNAIRTWCLVWTEIIQLSSISFDLSIVREYCASSIFLVSQWQSDFGKSEVRFHQCSAHLLCFLWNSTLGRYLIFFIFLIASSHSTLNCCSSLCLIFTTRHLIPF